MTDLRRQLFRGPRRSIPVDWTVIDSASNLIGQFVTTPTNLQVSNYVTSRGFEPVQASLEPELALAIAASNFSHRGHI